MGAYQMGIPALQDADFIDSNYEWTSLAHQYGVYDRDTFLSNQPAQDFAVTRYHKKLATYIDYYGLDKYIGTVYCGVRVTSSGLLAACHLVGIGGMKKGLINQIVVRDGNGVAASEYMDIFSGYNVIWVW